MADFVRLLRRAASMPPGTVLRKAAGRLRQWLDDRQARFADLRNSTFLRAEQVSGELAPLLDESVVNAYGAGLEPDHAAVANFLDHRFSLLGSDWVKVRYGMQAAGFGGHRYPRGEEVVPNGGGKWLENRINASNLRESQAIWGLVAPEYDPIDWHIDCKSGFRWKEITWYKDVRYGHLPGVDVKLPWELARMQHLPQLAVAYGCVRKSADAGNALTQRIESEFRNQILDFIAVNPPRWGVNWSCTMDVAIRVANWVMAYDLMRCFGAEFDGGFKRIFTRSVCEHALHIAGNLEWSEELRGNHYLADVAGLVFASAYLPCGPQTDAWLALGMREFLSEVPYQFNPDGSNFEASTYYHRLSAEMVAYTTALLFALPEPPPLPGIFLERLRAIRRFSEYITGSDGRFPQIGDNDAGRFLRISARYSAALDASNRYLNLSMDTSAQPRLVEDQLEVESLHRAFTGLSHGGGPVVSLSGWEAVVTRAYCRTAGVFAHHPEEGRGAPDGWTLESFPDFGLYVYRSPRFELWIRCGSIGQRGYGGHAHNDQHSFELAADGQRVVVDPGTFVYTPKPEARNYFRSTGSHNTLALGFQPVRFAPVQCQPGNSGSGAVPEQCEWDSGPEDLFRLREDAARATLIAAGPNSFCGEHYGFGAAHRRTVELEGNTVRGFDECSRPGTKYVNFHLSPDACARKNGGVVTVSVGTLILRFQHDAEALAMEYYPYSRSYGWLERSTVIRLITDRTQVSWSWSLEA